MTSSTANNESQQSDCSSCTNGHEKSSHDQVSKNTNSSIDLNLKYENILLDTNNLGCINTKLISK